jgi:hypothetical protein
MMEFETDSCLSKTTIRLTIASLDSAQKKRFMEPLMAYLQRFLFLLVMILFGLTAESQTQNQPKVKPGPNEPDWVVLLNDRWGLEMFKDLANPVVSDSLSVPGLFQKAGEGPVTYKPTIALGLETTNRGGYYRPTQSGTEPARVTTWVYTFKNTTADIREDKNLPPPLHEGAKLEFDPGAEPFGVWVSNDGLKDGGVFSQPSLVKAVNARLASQPYKAMIYPLKDKKTGKVVPNAYLIGWEYSTNDDFQDVVCEIHNVKLIK